MQTEPPDVPPRPAFGGGRLHHVALGAGDADAVASFYRDVLGLREAARHLRPDGTLRSVWLALEPGMLMIESCGGPPRPVTDLGCGPFLLAFACAPAELADREALLGAAGVAIESRTAHTIYFRDPEGNRVALSSYEFFRR